MKDIEICYNVGNEIKQLKITFMANGIGQIMVGQWYHGQVVFSQNQWGGISCRQKRTKQ